MLRPKLLIAVFTIIFQTAVYSQDDMAEIESMYATSTALPFQQFAVESIFDGDKTTYWRTPTGAGPNEGIMIYFRIPTYISNVKIVQFQGEGLAEIKNTGVYGDGQFFMGGEYIDRELSSLYIKIAKTTHTEQIKSTIGDQKYTRNKFSKDHAVGIAELQLFGKDDKLLEVLPPSFVKGTITASSSLKPALAYGAGNLMDGKKDVAWSEGVKGNGIGETVTFTSEETIWITNIKIWNGYQRSPKHYDGNARLKTFQFGKKGSELKSYTIEDSSAPQIIDLGEELEGSEFVLKINSAYSGTKYQDLVISEIRFYYEDRPIIIKTDVEEKRVMHSNNEMSELITSFIDRNIEVAQSKNKSRKEGGITYSEFKSQTQSLILRSNNTFVLYEREYFSLSESSEEGEGDYDEDQKEVIADGNWELKSETDSSAVIRVFGKIYSPTTSAELYHGDVTSSNVKIFQDYLTITKDKITGKKYIKDIIIKY